VDRDDFKLSDDTMRNLRNIAQSPGELAWRMELLATLERHRMGHEIFTRAVLAELKRIKKDQVGPVKITEIVRTELTERLAQTTKDAGRVWTVFVWLAEKAAIIGGTYLAIWVGLKK
jgi:hypothetical protein